MFERFLTIQKVNFKYYLLPHIMIVAVLCLGSPLFMGVENLSELLVGVVIEQFLGLSGIILFLTLFLPELNTDIRDLISSKKISLLTLRWFRLLQIVFFLLITGLAYLGFLKSGNCDFDYFKMLYVFLANSIFLGGMGLLCFTFFDQVAIAYMVPLVYYIFNFTSGMEKLGNFYLFSMQRGIFEAKHTLMLSGLVMVVIAVLFKDHLAHICSRVKQRCYKDPTRLSGTFNR